VGNPHFSSYDHLIRKTTCGGDAEEKNGRELGISRIVEKIR
jgi:hypothetical protein